MDLSSIRPLIEPYLPEGIPWEYIELREVRVEAVTVAGRDHYSHCVDCMIQSPVKRVTATGAPRSLVPIAHSLPGVIEFAPGYLDFTTAAGISLIGHELVHQAQYATVENFLQQYHAEMLITPEDRPWENDYEHAAYSAERNIYCGLQDRFPAGAWTPLGRDIWGCTGAIPDPPPATTSSPSSYAMPLLALSGVAVLGAVVLARR